MTTDSDLEKMTEIEFRKLIIKSTQEIKLKIQEFSDHFTKEL